MCCPPHDPSDARRTAHLRALPGSSERLTLFAADLQREGSFDEAISGCEYVIHTAAPQVDDGGVHVPPAEVRRQLLDPAVRAVEVVLGSVARAPTVTRVVLSSKMSAVYGSPYERGTDHVYGESDWNTTASETVLPYQYGTVLVERRAWELAKGQDRWQLVVVVGGTHMGPPVHKSVDKALYPASWVAMVRAALAGAYSSDHGLCVVDVRDLAAAHTLAVVHPEAYGRYICTARFMPYSEVCTVGREALPPGVEFQTSCAEGCVGWLKYLCCPVPQSARDYARHNTSDRVKLHTSKITRDLGFYFHSVEAAVRGEVRALWDMGLIKSTS